MGVSGRCICGRVKWLEEQEERKLQTCRHVELEVEEEGCLCSKEGHQSFHQGTLRLQGQASVEDGEGIGHEEIEGGLELIFQMFCTSRKLWWAVPLSFLCNPLYRLFG